MIVWSTRDLVVFRAYCGIPRHTAAYRGIPRGRTSERACRDHGGTQTGDNQTPELFGIPESRKSGEFGLPFYPDAYVKRSSTSLLKTTIYNVKGPSEMLRDCIEINTCNDLPGWPLQNSHSAE